MDRSTPRRWLVAAAFVTASFIVACESRQGDPFEPERPGSVDSTKVEGIQSGTWRRSASPYYVMKDIVVPAGKTLTIEPGVVVVFTAQLISSPGRPAPAGAADRVNTGLIVRGRLVAEGTAERRIDFRPTSMRTLPPQPGDWETLSFERGSTGSLRDARVLYASTGITVQEASVTLVNCTLSNCRFDGVNATLSTLRLVDCTISTNFRDGLALFDCDSPVHPVSIEHCNIGNNFRSGIWGVNSSVVAERCDIKNNGLSTTTEFVQGGVHFEGLPGVNPPVFRRCNLLLNIPCDVRNLMPAIVSADSNYWGEVTTAQMNALSNPDANHPDEPIKFNCSFNLTRLCDAIDLGASELPTITFCWWADQAYLNFATSAGGASWPPAGLPVR